jgi:hypothetical protein
MNVVTIRWVIAALALGLAVQMLTLMGAAVM